MKVTMALEGAYFNICTGASKNRLWRSRDVEPATGHKPVEFEEFAWVATSAGRVDAAAPRGQLGDRSSIMKRRDFSSGQLLRAPRWP